MGKWQNLDDYCVEHQSKSYLLKEWDYYKNKKSPKDYGHGSGEQVWWLCDKGHSWLCGINSRVQGSGCPYCLNVKVLTGYNDLATLFPMLEKEWDYSKNDVLPTEIITGGKKKYWWVCEKGHSWEATIEKRKIGQGCPYCKNRRLLVGYNDLATVNPKLASEWDFDKNDFTPKDIIAGSNKSVWWVCEKGHSWKAPLNVRLYSGSGCPKCSPSTSIPEISIYLALKKIFNFVEHKKIINKVEYDIFINDLNLAIEYDGEFYHKDRRNQDLKKVELAKKLGFNFIRIYEVKGIVAFTEFRLEKDILYLDSKITKNYSLLCQMVIDYIAKVNKIKLPLLDLTNIEIEAREYRKNKDIVNSLEYKYPNIAKEWHPTKNGALKPSAFPMKSSYKAWWVCKNGHHWKKVIRQRTKTKKGCPYCV